MATKRATVKAAPPENGGDGDGVYLVAVVLGCSGDDIPLRLVIPPLSLSLPLAVDGRAGGRGGARQRHHPILSPPYARLEVEGRGFSRPKE